MIGENANSKIDQLPPARIRRWRFAAYLVFGLLLSGCETSDVQQVQSAAPKVAGQSESRQETEHREQTSSEPEDKTSSTADNQTDAAKASEAEQQTVDDASDDQQRAPQQQTIEIPDVWKRLGKEHEIWIDIKNKRVMVAGHIVMRAGPLEMFVCPRRTKEHESVIAVNALASEVHAALIAIGANPGTPVQWDPEYVAASGPVIDVSVQWKEKDNVIQRRGQEMVRDFETRKPIEHNWVFGGSQVYTDEETGTTYYYGDAGELICLSNFSTATMDLTIKSSDSNDSLMFEAFTENIPEIATKVYVVLTPQLDDKSASNPEDNANPKPGATDK